MPPWTWFAIAAPVALFAVGVLVWTQRRTCGRVWRYWTAWLRNDQHKFFSFARLVLGALILVGQIPVMRHEFFWAHGGAALVGVEVIAFFADITVSKTGAAVLTILAGKNSVSLSGVPGITQPTPAPDLKPTDQAG